jgi:hypothetical protein
MKIASRSLIPCTPIMQGFNMALLFEFYNHETGMMVYQWSEHDNPSMHNLSASTRIWKHQGDTLTFIKNRTIPFEKYHEVDMEEFFMLRLSANT